MVSVVCEARRDEIRIKQPSYNFCDVPAQGTTTAKLNRIILKWMKSKLFINIKDAYVYTVITNALIIFM